MESQKYGKERTIRASYRRMGGRRTYIQRRLYEMGTVNVERDRLDGFDEDDFVSSVLSTSLGRSRFLSQRRRVWMVCRTRGPGRFRHELRKRYEGLGRRRGVRTRRTWKWYESDVDVNRADRRRSVSFFLPLLVRLRRKRRGRSAEDSKENGRRPSGSRERRESRKRRIWRGLGRYILMLRERTELSSRRSRRIILGGYGRCMERWRRRRYRKSGRVNRA